VYAWIGYALVDVGFAQDASEAGVAIADEVVDFVVTEAAITRRRLAFVDVYLAMPTSVARLTNASVAGY
jgi:hypothetical protein